MTVSFNDGRHAKPVRAQVIGTAVERDLANRERVDTPRVRHLFPVPDDADWEVRELDYDRHNRAG